MSSEVCLGIMEDVLYTVGETTRCGDVYLTDRAFHFISYAKMASRFTSKLRRVSLCARQSRLVERCPLAARVQAMICTYSRHQAQRNATMSSSDGKRGNSVPQWIPRGKVSASGVPLQPS